MYREKQYVGIAASLGDQHQTIGNVGYRRPAEPLSGDALRSDHHGPDDDSWFVKAARQSAAHDRYLKITNRKMGMAVETQAASGGLDLQESTLGRACYGHQAPISPAGVASGRRNSADTCDGNYNNLHIGLISLVQPNSAPAGVAPAQ